MLRPLLLLAAILAAAIPAGDARAQRLAVPAPYADQQIRLPTPAASATKRQAPSAAPAAAQPAPPRGPSLVRQAAHGRILEDLQLEDGRLLEEQPLQQAGHTAPCGCATGNAPTGLGDLIAGTEPLHGFDGDCGPATAGCDGDGCAHCADACTPAFHLLWRRFEFFAGVSSFTGPANHASDSDTRRGGAGSFGFYEGFNEGRSLDHLLGIDLASQLGLRATQSNLSGAEFTEDARKQIFLTGGLFRRVDFGLQYGLAVDYLYDDWWYRNDLVQLRGELSWNDAGGHEYGYQFMLGTQDATSSTRLLDEDGDLVSGSVRFDPTDQHRLFLRGSTRGGSSYMAFAGGTDRGDGLLGGSLTSAFQGRFAVQGSATYVIPSQSARQGGYANETWNLSLGIVFRPGGKTVCGRYCRPLFDVADNGTFLIDRR